MGLFSRKNKNAKKLDKVFSAVCATFNDLQDNNFQMEPMLLLPILHGISASYITMIYQNPESLLQRYDEIFNDKLCDMDISPEYRMKLLQISNGAYCTSCETAQKVVATNKNIQIDQLFVVSASQTLCEAVGADAPDTILDMKMLSLYYYLNEAMS